MVHSSPACHCKGRIAQGMLHPMATLPWWPLEFIKLLSCTPTTALFIMSLLALLANIAVFGYMVYKIIKTRRNPYLGELYTDLPAYKKIKALAQ